MAAKVVGLLVIAVARVLTVPLEAAFQGATIFTFSVHLPCPYLLLMKVSMFDNCLTPSPPIIVQNRIMMIQN